MDEIITAESMTAELLREAIPELTDEQARRFIIYYDELIERNRSVNLTRITSPAEVSQKHFADSLLGMAMIPQGARVIDVGTGAGFPGIPLAIMRPDMELTLVDSLGKRVRFLEEVTEKLGIRARCIHARAEDAARNDALRAHFDIALTRAVAPMNVLLELTVPFLKVGGRSLMYKAGGVEAETEACSNAVKVLSCSLTVTGFEVPWGARTVVSAEKLAKTPSAYPRRAGTAQKKPL